MFSTCDAHYLSQRTWLFSTSSSRCKLSLFPHLVWRVYIYSFNNKYPLLVLTFETSGGRSFSYMTSSPLNKLPVIVRGADTVSVFTVRFNTHLGQLTIGHTNHSFHFLNPPPPGTQLFCYKTTPNMTAGYSGAIVKDCGWTCSLKCESSWRHTEEGWKSHRSCGLVVGAIPDWLDKKESCSQIFRRQ